MEGTETLCPHATILNHRWVSGTHSWLLSVKPDQWMHLSPIYTRVHGEWLRYANSTSQFHWRFLLVRDDWGFQVNPLCRHDITSPFPPSGNEGYVRNRDVVCITCGLLWFFDQLFGLSFWRHPFTAVYPLVSKRCNAIYSKLFWWRIKFVIWMAWGWVHFQQICELTIPLILIIMIENGHIKINYFGFKEYLTNMRLWQLERY